MNSISDNWWNEDRRDLFRSLEVIASEAPNPDRIGLCLDTILNDLELYDDPRQGGGAWIFDNELQLAEALGEQVAAAVNQVRLVDAGPAALSGGRPADVMGNSTMKSQPMTSTTLLLQ